MIGMEYFEAVEVGSGGEHYAEIFYHDTYLKMPFNALVNVGYVIVGLFWLTKVQSLPIDKVHFKLLTNEYFVSSLKDINIYAEKYAIFPPYGVNGILLRSDSVHADYHSRKILGHHRSMVHLIIKEKLYNIVIIGLLFLSLVLWSLGAMVY